MSSATNNTGENLQPSAAQIIPTARDARTASTQLSAIANNISALWTQIDGLEKTAKYNDAQARYDDLLRGLLAFQAYLNNPPFQSIENINSLSNLINYIAGRKNAISFLNDSNIEILNIGTSRALSAVQTSFIEAMQNLQSTTEDYVKKLDAEKSGGTGSDTSADANTIANYNDIFGPEAAKEISDLNGIVTLHDDLRFKFDTIAGNEQIINTVRATMRSTMDSNSIILYGPPGAGKNTIIEAVADGFNRNLIVIPVGGILSMYQGESEKNILKVMNLVRLVWQNSIVCLDEIESLVTDRAQASTILSRDTLITTFLTSFDGLKEKKYLWFTTNWLQRIDPAVRRRLTPILVDYPSADEAVNVFVSLLSQYNIENIESLDRERIRNYLSRGKYSPASMNEIIKSAFVSRINRERGVTCNVPLAYNAKLNLPVYNVCVYGGEQSVDELGLDAEVYPPALTPQDIYTQLENSRAPITEEEYQRYVAQ